MKSTQIRQKFFDYFIKNGHEKVASSPLIPAQDPTLLFTNAGMNQFKDVFLGQEKRSYTRAVTIQKCMRAGGKHNDLDNVGFTKRHLTFFEMMGNFSFSDYFKKEAIQYAWDFLTKELNLKPENLYTTVFLEDDESYEIWNKQIGLPKERISKLGAKDNFWQMGDTGPCGPCTEIYIDKGLNFGCDKESCAPGCDCDRFMEIWNNVFMQYDRQFDGKLIPLKQTGVDTGMGLERLCSVMQNKESVFETDLFEPIIKKIEELTGISYNGKNHDPSIHSSFASLNQNTQGERDFLLKKNNNSTLVVSDFCDSKNCIEPYKPAFHVLADHIRACTFLIADGCSPSNEGRGYVLRKIIRRAALFEQKLVTQSIFPDLASVVIEFMTPIYPELKINEVMIKSVLKSEIDKFAYNLSRGKNILEEYFTETKNSKVITGEQAFKLYDTFGFPVEIVEAAAKERGWKVDIIGFEKEMEKQREQSGKKIEKEKIELDESITTEFVGYKELEVESEIIAITSGFIIPKKTPFFVETGGQVSDKGWVIINNQKFEVLDLKKIGKAIGIKIKTEKGDLSSVMSSDLSFEALAKEEALAKQEALLCPPKLYAKAGAKEDKIIQKVDKETRTNTMKNHTATHLLQAALIQLFGKQIKQSGSVVHPDYLRFDFTFHRNLTSEEIIEVEKIVNLKITENFPVNIYETTYKDAINKGVIAIFGEKYNPEKVRVIDIDPFSKELCGGTHVNRTGDIGCFKITEVSALSAGNRRIVALTGPKAIELFQQNFNAIKELSQEFKVKPEEVVQNVLKQKEHLRELQNQIAKLKKESWKSQISNWLNKIEIINNTPTLILILENLESSELKEIATELNNKKPGFYFIASNQDEKSNFITFVANEYKDKINLKEFSNWLRQELKLSGGGKDNLIQGGGPKLDKSVEDKIRERLSK